MGWDDGPDLPRETTHTETGRRTTGRRRVIFVLVAVAVIIGFVPLMYFGVR